ncbi:MAG: hypothetical protein CV087_21065 [Candidatus Brocadia sp. WS118]|nr:MAG: hypothetical protein CV087_21065 [Candidatus Brocadia sp. WS118]
MRTTIDEIRNFGFLKKRLDAVKNLVSENPENLIPWIGAGLSIPYGMPSWSGFLNELSTKLPDNDDISVVNYCLRRGLLDLAAEFIAVRLEAEIDREMVKAFAFTQPMMPGDTPHFLSRLGIRIIVTTNYDRVIETTMPWFVPVTPDNFRRSAFKTGQVLLKLHGTIENPKSWVLTRSQYVRLYTPELWNQIREIFSNYSVLFLGCSLVSDPYLDVLRNIPREERCQHYAVLSVNSNEEAEQRGKDLEEIGILIIPYITEGDHSFVQELISYIQPSLTDTLNYVIKLKKEQQFEKAAILLNSCTQDKSLTEREKGRLSASIVDLIRAEIATNYVSTPPPLRLSRLARKAVDLNPDSENVLEVTISVLDSIGEETKKLKQKLAKIRTDTVSIYAGLLKNNEDVVNWSSSSDNNIRRVYELYRSGKPKDLRRELVLLSKRNSLPGDRIAIYLLRASLLDNTVHSEKERFFKTASNQIVHFGNALINAHYQQFENAIDNLDRLDRLWRASSEKRGRGLTFSLWLRCFCYLGLKKYKLASESIYKALSSYIPIQQGIQRLFYNKKTATIPSEFCYDHRRLGSYELHALLEFWHILTEIHTNPMNVKESKISSVLGKINKAKANDLLLEWYSLILEFISSEVALRQDEIERKFNKLLASCKGDCPGLLREIVLAFEVIKLSDYGEFVETKFVEQLQLAAGL